MDNYKNHSVNQKETTGGRGKHFIVTNTVRYIGVTFVKLHRVTQP